MQTFLNTALPEKGANLASPVNGAIVRWRVQGAKGGPFYLRVLHPNGTGGYMAPRHRATRRPRRGTGLQTFTANLPVHAGDLIGIDPTNATDKIGVAEVPGASYASIFPPPFDGATVAPSGDRPGQRDRAQRRSPADPDDHLDLAELRLDAGGTSVTITGTDFIGASAVKFGTMAATSFTVILGMDCRHNMGEARSRIGYMPENDSFIGEMTAVTFLRQMAELSGLPPKAALEKAHEVLFHVGLGESRYRELRTYSYGMKQMAKLAQAIVHGPELVVLDEPTNGLDPAARRRMLKLVIEMKEEQGMNVLVCSHLLRDIEQVCDEAVILKDGAIVHHCNLEEERRSNRSLRRARGDRRRSEPADGAAGDRRRGRVRRRRALAHRPAGGGRGRSDLGTRGAAEPAGEEAHAPPGHAGGDLPESHGPPGAHARGRAAATASESGLRTRAQLN